jgi:hypothetical protein
VDPETREFTGPDITFVYPDFRTGIRGTFHKGVLVSGVQAVFRIRIRIRIRVHRTYVFFGLPDADALIRAMDPDPALDPDPDPAIIKQK